MKVTEYYESPKQEQDYIDWDSTYFNTVGCMIEVKFIAFANLYGIVESCIRNDFYLSL